MPRELGEATPVEVIGHTLDQSKRCERVSDLNGGVFPIRCHKSTRVSSDRVYSRSTAREEDKRAVWTVLSVHTSAI